MANGNVKWFDDKKGFGFITLPGGNDAFVHHSDIETGRWHRLDGGEPVEYDLTETAKGKRATKVRRLSKVRGQAKGDRSAGHEAGA